ncbi:hypothetical protein [Ekhidna sp.]|uniref:hypothetical protein n=1 Tax=Ekhidna sp. TaxID=2608089 RepID=UPI003512183A
MELRSVLYLSCAIALFNLKGQVKDYQEEVHLSVNTTNILVGETLYFSAFIYSNTSKRLSSLSSILYLELVDESGSSVYKTKIGLREGRGAGQLYIDPAWRSNTYRIKAYTRWMKNYQSFFEQKILVLNPYMGITLNELISGNPLKNSKNIKSDIDTYGQLKNVSMDLGHLESSTLSIAVNKVERLYFPNEITLENPAVNMSTFDVLPEYRYGLVQGVVMKLLGNVDQLRVNMTIKGDFMQVSTTKTDTYGRFWMSYNPELSANESEVQIQVEGDSIQQIIILDEFYENHDPLDTSVVSILDSSSVFELVDRSVNSQIKIAYANLENDKSTNIDVFTEPYAKVYRLSDYKRFATIRDTFIELIPYVGVSKSESNYKMNVRCEIPPGMESLDKPPLILLDGLKVSPESIFNQSPNDIEKIEVIPKYYFVQDIVYKGIISIQTTSGKKKSDLSSFAKSRQFTDYQPYKASINTLKINSNLPLYDPNIYWEPIRRHNDGQLIIDFSTPRLDGLYKISITGISESGSPINLAKYFQVSKTIK